jgi:hypothetical protein
MVKIHFKSGGTENNIVLYNTRRRMEEKTSWKKYFSYIA